MLNVACGLQSQEVVHHWFLLYSDGPQQMLANVLKLLPVD